MLNIISHSFGVVITMLGVALLLIGGINTVAGGNLHETKIPAMFGITMVFIGILLTVIIW